MHSRDATYRIQEGKDGVPQRSKYSRETETPHRGQTQTGRRERGNEWQTGWERGGAGFPPMFWRPMLTRCSENKFAWCSTVRTKRLCAFCHCWSTFTCCFVKWDRKKSEHLHQFHLCHIIQPHELYRTKTWVIRSECCGDNTCEYETHDGRQHVNTTTWLLPLSLSTTWMTQTKY